jgi:hypothetical protein
LPHALLRRAVPDAASITRTILPLCLRPDPFGGPRLARQVSIRTASAARSFSRKEPVMSKKGNKTKGNKESKKPKQEKPKVLATANSGAGKPALVVAGKSVK